MAKLTAAFIIGLGLGAGVVLLVMGRTGGPEPTSPTPGTIERSPAVTTATRTQASGSQVMSLADMQSLPSDFERRAALYARLESTDVDAVEILLDEAEQLTSPRRVKQVIYSRYVQLDPRAALARLRREERDQQPLVRTTASAVAGIDLDAALAFMDTLDESLQAQSARNILDLEGLSDARKEEVAKRFGLERYLWQLQASRRAKDDPAGAWETALATEKGEERDAMLWSVADTWVETNPVAALTAVASLDAADRRGLQSTLVRRWASQDPDAALEWALARPGSGEFDPLWHVAGEIAEQSPQEMFDLVETLEPPRRNRVADDVLRAWGRTDPVAALNALMAMKNAAYLADRVGVSVVGSWARDDPRAAFEWVRAQSPSPARSSMLARTLAILGESDPARALALSEELDGVARSRAIEDVLGTWGEEDPLAAVAWLDATGDKTAGAVRVVASRYAEADPEGAFEWLQDQSVEAQSLALPSVVRQMAADSPDSALRQIDRMAESNAKLAARFQLMSTWVETDPPGAVRAIARMDDSVGQPLYAFAFQRWSSFDPESARAFLERIPSSHRDGAIQGMMQQAALSDLDHAEQLFERLKGDESRRAAAATLFHALHEVDPERAERYRELSGMADEQRIRLEIYR